MVIRVRIPSALQRYSSGRELDSEGATVGEALHALPADLRERVLDERGRLRSHLLVFVEDRDAALTDALADGDLVEIVGAVEGG